MTILTTTLAIGVALASLWAAVQSALRQQAGQSVERALAQGLLVLALLGLTAWWLDIAPLARISGIGLMLLGAAAALRFVGRHRVPPAVLAAFGLALLAGRVG
ncbi:MAG: hypothetical protein ABNH26_13960 [Celeribacter sp.]